MKSIIILLPLICFISCTTTNKDALIKKHYDLGVSFLASGDYSHALGELQEVEKEEPDNPINLQGIGLAYLGLKKPQVAETYFQKSLKIQPSTQGHLNLCSCYIEQEKYDLALKHCNLTLKDDTFIYQEQSLNNIGYIHYKRGNFKEAKKYYSRSLYKNPTFYLANLNNGILLAAEGDNSSAIDFFKQAIRGCGNCPEAIYRLGLAYHSLKKEKEAKFYFNKTIKMNPSTLFAKEAKTLLAKMR